MKSVLSPRVVLVVIAAMFLLPLALAWLMYTGAIDYRPASTRNLGQLVEPPLPLDWQAAQPLEKSGQTPAEVFRRHWVVLHAVPTPCDEVCVRAITGLRQVHRAAGREQSRLRLALLTDLDAATARRLLEIYPRFHLIEDPSGETWSLLAAASGNSDLPGPVRGNSYLIDPLGNIMMHYAAGYDPNDLKKDLKRLLTWSKLDEQ